MKPCKALRSSRPGLNGCARICDCPARCSWSSERVGYLPFPTAWGGSSSARGVVTKIEFRHAQMQLQVSSARTSGSSRR